MNTRTVPVEPTEEMHKAAWIVYLNADKRYVQWRDILCAAYKAMLASAPPQPEPKVYQCPRCATSMEVDPTAKPTNAAPPQSEPWRCNLTGMKGCAYPKNAAPEQAGLLDTPGKSDAQPESLRPESAPVAAPFSYDKDRGKCSDHATRAQDHQSEGETREIESSAVPAVAPDTHLRSRIDAAKARQAKGEGLSGDVELAHYGENHAPNFEPNNIVFCAGAGTEILRLDKNGMLYKGERVLDAGQAYTAFTNWLKQNETWSAASFKPSTSTTVTLPSGHDMAAARTTDLTQPSASSTLPLSADRVEAWRTRLSVSIDQQFRTYANEVCDQALRAIELEHDLQVSRACNDYSHALLLKAEAELEQMRKFLTLASTDEENRLRAELAELRRVK